MLNKAQIRKLIEENDLITEYIDLEKQLTPNGFDLTVHEVFEYLNSGTVDFSNQHRHIPLMCSVEGEIWHLEAGAYTVVYNEIVKMPLNLAALARPRSTLLRSGVTVDTGVWDAGYNGIANSALFVVNKHGFTMHKNARIVQLILFPVDETESYVGVYQGEGIKGKTG